MNYIRQIEQENMELKEQLRLANQLAEQHLKYYTSAKFQGSGNDYAHISTDVLHKIQELKNATAR